MTDNDHNVRCRWRPLLPPARGPGFISLSHSLAVSLGSLKAILCLSGSLSLSLVSHSLQLSIAIAGVACLSVLGDSVAATSSGR